MASALDGYDPLMLLGLASTLLVTLDLRSCTPFENPADGRRARR